MKRGNLFFSIREVNGGLQNRLFLFYRRTIHIWSLISEVELFCLIKADPT